jgi:hypothetical protein
MYLYREDLEESILVAMHVGVEQSDDDYGTSLVLLRDVDLAASERQQPFVHIMSVDDEVKLPNASWRKRIADANKKLTAKRYLFAFVTPSALARGTFTAINWLTPWPPGHDTAAFATFPLACAWVRSQTGNVYSKLEAMERDARRQSSGKLRVASR